MTSLSNFSQCPDFQDSIVASCKGPYKSHTEFNSCCVSACSAYEGTGDNMCRNKDPNFCVNNCEDESYMLGKITG